MKYEDRIKQIKDHFDNITIEEFEANLERAGMGRIKSATQIYFDEVNEKINALSDEEFDQLLIDCGIEECPYEDEWERYYITGV